MGQWLQKPIESKYSSTLKLIEHFLGEKQVSIHMPPVLTTGITTIVSKGIPFSINRIGDAVRIRGGSGRIKTLAWPNLYHFKGAYSRENDSVNLNGYVRLSIVAKCMIIGWFLLVSVSFVFMSLWMVCQIFGLVESSSDVTGDGIYASGKMLLLIVGVSSYGAVVLFVIRVISNSQRRKLIDFCESSGLRAT